MDYKLLLDVSVLAGEIMAQNGAETYRIEDTMRRILVLSELKTAEVFVTLTGFFATLDHPTMDSMTVIRRISTRELNLSKIHEVNIVSRKLCCGEISLEEALKQLKMIKRKEDKVKARFLEMLTVTAGFTLALGGGVWDVIAAGITGLFSAALLKIFKKKKMHMFLSNSICGVVIAIVAFTIKSVGIKSLNLDSVIIGAIMPFVPGVAITNAVFDTLHGDYLSGIGRAVEATVIAVSVAGGIGLGMSICQWFVRIV